MVIHVSKTLLIASISIALFMVSASFQILQGLRTIECDSKKLAFIAIVIDDFGNAGDGTVEMFELEIPITAAVMPYLPFSNDEAQKAFEYGHEVILHIPLEPVTGKAQWLGPKGITTNLSSKEIRSRITDGLKEIQWAVGMNNHMGSKAMQDERVMTVILEIAKENNLYYLDSKTTPLSVAKDIADDLGVPYFSRDVFLDNIKNQGKIEKQLLTLASIALEKGYAIGIGHVGPEGGKVTANAIAAIKDEIESMGIKFVHLSQLRDLVRYL